VLLSGQEYWDINNLEVSNIASTAGTRRGVRVIATGVSHHIHLVGLNVHNVKGQLGTDATSKNTGGIGFESTGGAGSSFDDILVQNCTIAHADDVGLYLSSDSGTNPRSANWSQAKWNNVVIQGNQLNDIGKNAMVVRVSDTPLIENNVINGSSTRLHGNAIYTISTLNAVIQFNEVYNTALTGYSGLEDCAFDPDNNSVGTLIQYNYSHNNAGGLANPNMIPGTGNFSDGTIIRYNISQDDVNQIIQFSGAATNTQIYNNTIYIGAGLSPAVFSAHLWGGTGNWANNTTYSNNIIYNAGNATYDLGSSTNNTFSANLFFGNHPASEPGDSKKITTNPLLQNPGSGGTGMNTLNGYQLQPGSPAVGSGVAISNNGGRDFFAATLPSGAPDRGAAQSTSTCAVPSAPANLAAAAASSSQINLSWSAVAAGCPVTYSVYRSTTAGFTPSSANQVASGLTTTAYSDTALTCSTPYYYLVVAADAFGSSAASNQATATTQPCACSAAPTAPTGLSATAVSTSAINQSWTASTAPSGCTITYSVTRNGATAASGLTGTTFGDSGLTCSTAYTYTVVAADEFGSSAASSPATATTQACACSAAPPTPTGLSATAASSTAINLGWTASPPPSNCTITYSVTRNGAAAASGLTGTTFGDSGLTCNTAYTYTVTAADAFGSSAASSPANATTSSCPTSVKINAGGAAVAPFSADADFTGGATINHANAINLNGQPNPAPAAVYQTARVTATPGAGTTFSYTIPGFNAGSSHTVRLHFCETFWTAVGQRVFNVSLNGTQVLPNFDVFKTAGGQNRALIQSFTSNANSNGQYVIVFTSVTDKALISGIEVQ
jgi:hypothetical protein